MNETLLVTGGTGLLGINWALMNRDSYSVVLGLHERSVFLSGIEVRYVDLESVDRLIHAFEAIQPQIVIHTAGFTNVEKCESKPDLAHLINVVLAENVAKCCAKLGLPLVHISTDHLFSGEEQLVDETQPVAPQNIYGRTKAEAELRVLEAYPQALVVRTNFFGWGPTYRQSFSDVVIAALRSRKELSLFHDVFYTPILIEPLVRAVHELISHKASGIFHVVGDERISKYQFGLKIAEEFKLDATLIKPGFIADQSTLVKRPFEMSLSNHKVCTLLGRSIGSVTEHIKKLHLEEQGGLCQEIKSI